MSGCVTLGEALHSVTMFFSCLSYFWGNDGVIGAPEFLIYILYIGKHSRENTFTNFNTIPCNNLEREIMH